MLKHIHILAIGLLTFVNVSESQAQEYCCDPDAINFSGNAAACSAEDGGFFESDDVVCDIDCTGYNSACDPILGCTIPEACNYNPEATEDDGSCDFFSCIVFGCNNPAACNYDPEVTFNDGSCDFISCLTQGCTIEIACNYNPEADLNDGTCDFVTCQGCVNELACNYDPEASIDNGLCELPLAPYDCDGNCVNDINDDGVCDEFVGCTESNARNYSALAITDDNSCEYFSCAQIDAPTSVLATTMQVPFSRMDHASFLTPSANAAATAKAMPTTMASATPTKRPMHRHGRVQLQCLRHLGRRFLHPRWDVDEIDDVDPCIGELDECGVCNGPGDFTDAAVPPSLKTIATVTETNSTRLVSAGATARQTPTSTTCATILTTVSANMTRVESVTDRVPSTNVPVLTLQKETATATETNPTPWVCAVVTALQTRIPTAFATRRKWRGAPTRR